MMWNALIVLVAVVISAVPWGLPEEATFILPFLTLLLIFSYAVPRERLIPAWLAFLAGVIADILTAGPLGYWAFLYTLGFALARLMAQSAPAESRVVLWMQFLLVATLVAGSGWLLASLYYLRPIDWWPMALGALVAMGVCPLVLWRVGRGHGQGRTRPFALGQ